MLYKAFKKYGIENFTFEGIEEVSNEYLDEQCQNCTLLEKCGGGCAMSCGNENLTSDYFVKKMS